MPAGGLFKTSTRFLLTIHFRARIHIMNCTLFWRTGDWRCCPSHSLTQAPPSLFFFRCFHFYRSCSLFYIFRFVPRFLVNGGNNVHVYVQALTNAPIANTTRADFSCVDRETNRETEKEDPVLSKIIRISGRSPLGTLELFRWYTTRHFANIYAYRRCSYTAIIQMPLDFHLATFHLETQFSI